MDTTKRVMLALLLSTLAGIVFIQPAKAETINCININTIPATISTQGVYCFNQHMPVSLASGSAITVLVNNVTIDCNEYKLGNLAAGPANSAIGVSAISHLNVTVRNCGIRGFRTGVSLTNGQYRVEDNRFDLNTETAVNISGDGSTVRRNEVINTGDSTIGGLTEFHGILGNGDIDVIDNTVSGVIASNGSNGTVYGILTQNMDAGTIKGNRVRLLDSDGTGLRRGIWNTGGSHVTVESNTVVMNAPFLSLLSNEGGIRCGDGIILDGAARDNTVLGVGVLGAALGLVACTPAVANFVNPL